jgi:hypothetical protein
MNTSTKRLLIIIGVAALFCLVAVAVAVAGMGVLFNRVKSGITQDQAQVRKLAHTMIDYQLPAGYTEQMSMDLLVYKMVFIAADDYDSHPTIILAQFQQKNLDPQEMARQIEQAAEQQNGRNGASLNLVETRTVTIRGQQVPLAISEGTDSKGATLRQWLTVFDGKTGSILIMVQGSVDGWDDTALYSFLDSIK